jgi:8-oxo-dGTP pyrophosphatase MutT (NUDIX family)
MTDPDFVIPFDRLPERFAESLDHPPEVPAKPRPAATIVLMRDGPDGLEILLMKRNRSAGFVPGAYVFPGGRVDASDATEELLVRVAGLTPEHAAERLDLVGAEPPAIAYFLAALREAFEETGIFVGIDAEGAAPPTAAEDAEVDAARDDLMEGRCGLAAMLARLGWTLDGASVEYFAHWITPVPEPRRYDTRFFAAKVRAGATPVIDPREMTDAVWLSPADALTRCDNGSLPMVFPTIKTLEQLEGYETAEEALSGLAGLVIRTVMPTLVVTPTGIGMQVGKDDAGDES